TNAAGQRAGGGSLRQHPRQLGALGPVARARSRDLLSVGGCDRRAGPGAGQPGERRGRAGRGPRGSAGVHPRRPRPHEGACGVFAAGGGHPRKPRPPDGSTRSWRATGALLRAIRCAHAGGPRGGGLSLPPGGGAAAGEPRESGGHRAGDRRGNRGLRPAPDGDGLAEEVKMRKGGRGARELRSVEIRPNFLAHAEGSVLVSFGNTKVIVAASGEDRVPPHRVGTGRGWITAEYGMLPRSTHTRTQREAAKGKQSGRTLEIQRLIGRALRSAADLDRLGPLTITLDCDVIQADGGTRTASITGAWVALVLATRRLREMGKISSDPIVRQVAAVSVGIFEGQPLLDLDFGEDSEAEVDLNLVASDQGEIIEVQGTAEKKPFSRGQLDALIDLGLSGIERLL